jgi:hypothetical protein
MSYIRQLRQHAEWAEQQAQRCELPNVRARYQQSAKAWTELAEHAERFKDTEAQTISSARAPRL